MTSEKAPCLRLPLAFAAALLSTSGAALTAGPAQAWNMGPSMGGGVASSAASGAAAAAGAAGVIARALGTLGAATLLLTSTGWGALAGDTGFGAVNPMAYQGAATGTVHLPPSPPKDFWRWSDKKKMQWIKDNPDPDNYWIRHPPALPGTLHGAFDEPGNITPPLPLNPTDEQVIEFFNNGVRTPTATASVRG